MTSIALCVLSFVVCFKAAKRSLILGICMVLGVGYVYGVVRANLPDGFSHVFFDAGVLGLYAAQLWRPQPHWQSMRSEELRNWIFILMAWPVLLFFSLRQDPLIQVVGLRGNIFLIPFILLGARLTGDDIYKLALWLSVLNLAAGVLAGIEFVVGVEPFFPKNAVTDIIYRSKDLADYTAYRIPSSFSSAHAYAGTMVMTIAIIAGAWVQPHYGKWQARLMGAALLMSMLGVFMSATRVNALILFALVMTTVFSGRIPGAYRFRYLIVLAAVGYVVAGEERLQRFTTLQDPEFLSERLVGSVNLTFFELAGKYPLGNGLGGGGTSVPHFLQARIRNVVTMENEYARILLELGLPGLVMWGLFIGWVFTRGNIRRTDMFYFGRRLVVRRLRLLFRHGIARGRPVYVRPRHHADVPAHRVVRRPRSPGGARGNGDTLRFRTCGNVQCPRFPDRKVECLRFQRDGVSQPLPTDWVIVAGGFHDHGAMDSGECCARRLPRRARRLRPPRGARNRRAVPPRPACRVPRRSAPPLAAPLAESLLSRRGLSVAAQVTSGSPNARVVVNGGNCPWPDINWVHAVHAVWQVQDEGAPAWVKVKHRAVKAIARRQERAALRAARTVIANSQATRRAIVEARLAYSSRTPCD